MQLLVNAWAGGATATRAFQMQKMGDFSVMMTADTWSIEGVTMQKSPDGTNQWNTYAPDGVAETWTSSDEDDTRGFRDGPGYFRFIGDAAGTAVDMHIWVGGQGLTTVGDDPTYS